MDGWGATRGAAAPGLRVCAATSDAICKYSSKLSESPRYSIVRFARACGRLVYMAAAVGAHDGRERVHDSLARSESKPQSTSCKWRAPKKPTSGETRVVSRTISLTTSYVQPGVGSCLALGEGHGGEGGASLARGQWCSALMKSSRPGDRAGPPSLARVTREAEICEARDARVHRIWISWPVWYHRDSFSRS